MKVYFVGAGPGDPQLLTLKAADLLRRTKCCIWAGSLVNPKLLEFLPADAQRYDSAGMTLEEIIDVMKRSHANNVDVVRLHTGEPSIYGAIAEQMNALDEIGIEYEIVPGISSFQAAAAAAKVELTVPEISQAVILARAAGRTPVPSGQEIEKLAATGATLCLFLSAGMMDDVTARLAANYGADCPAVAVFHASWEDQKIVRGTLGDIAGKMLAEAMDRTAMVIVGRVLERPAGKASKLYDKNFSHGYRGEGSK